MLLPGVLPGTLAYQYYSIQSGTYRVERRTIVKFPLLLSCRIAMDEQLNNATQWERIKGADGSLMPLKRDPEDPDTVVNSIFPIYHWMWQSLLMKKSWDLAFKGVRNEPRHVYHWYLSGGFIGGCRSIQCWWLPHLNFYLTIIKLAFLNVLSHLNLCLTTIKLAFPNVLFLSPPASREALIVLNNKEDLFCLKFNVLLVWYRCIFLLEGAVVVIFTWNNSVYSKSNLGRIFCLSEFGVFNAKLLRRL